MLKEKILRDFDFGRIEKEIVIENFLIIIFFFFIERFQKEVFNFVDRFLLNFAKYKGYQF